MAMFRNGLGSPFPVGTNPVSNATAGSDLPRAAVATDGQPLIDEENTRLDRVMKICRNCLPSRVGAQEARRHEPSISRNETATIPVTGAQN